MGYDQHQQSNSSGAAVAIVVAVLLVATVGILAVAGAWILLVRTSSVQSRVIAMDQQVVAELRQGEITTRLRPNVEATPEPRLNFEVTLGREGNTSVDGKEIGLDELKAIVAKLKDETHNTFSVRINADSGCPVKHVVPVLDVCDEVGDIDYSIVSSDDADLPASESNTGEGSDE